MEIKEKTSVYKFVWLLWQNSVFTLHLTHTASLSYQNATSNSEKQIFYLVEIANLFLCKTDLFSELK